MRPLPAPLLALVLAAPVAAPLAAQDGTATAPPPLIQSVVLATTPAELWRINTTVEGLQEWMVPFAHVDLRPGGVIETSYDGAAEPGDPANIRQHLQALQPERLLASRGSLAPPFAQQLDDPTIHGVLHIEAVDPRHTRFTTVMLGWGEGQVWEQARAFFVQGNRWYLDQLAARYPEDQVAQDRAAALLDAWSGPAWLAEDGSRWSVAPLGPERSWLIRESDGTGAVTASALIGPDPETGALSCWRLGADGTSARAAVWAEDDGLHLEAAWVDAGGSAQRWTEWLGVAEDGELVLARRTRTLDQDGREVDGSSPRPVAFRREGAER